MLKPRSQFQQSSRDPLNASLHKKGEVITRGLPMTPRRLKGWCSLRQSHAVMPTAIHRPRRAAFIIFRAPRRRRDLYRHGYTLYESTQEHHTVHGLKTLTRQPAHFQVTLTPHAMIGARCHLGKFPACPPYRRENKRRDKVAMGGGGSVNLKRCRR